MASFTTSFLFLFATALVLTTTDALKHKVTHIQFYMHESFTGPNPSSIRVAPVRPLNFSNPDQIADSFGSIYVLDNLLTATPDLSSTLIGRAQGMYAISSKQPPFSFSITLTFVMVSGPYEGSTLTVSGQNLVMQDIRELPIVGGTGKFRLARGYTLARTYSLAVGMNAVEGYNVTVMCN